MNNYKLKDVHLEKSSDWKIFVAIGGVYDENSNWAKSLTNQEIIDLLNNAVISSSMESKLYKQQFRSSLSDFSTKL